MLGLLTSAGRRKLKHQRRAHIYEQRARERAANRSAARQKCAQPAVPFSYEAALQFLDARGIRPEHIRGGSIGLSSLETIAEHIEALDHSRPLAALHIGNFVGVSLAYLAWIVTSLHPDSRVMSIDPNLTHRGIERPTETVIALLSHFGLDGAVGILTGYSLEKSPSNDGAVIDGYDPVAHWHAEQSCSDQLGLLRLLCPARFDVSLIDGNHEGIYLQREIAVMADLLQPGGVLVLDDVNATWPEVERVYSAAAPDRFTKVGTDGRVGVLRRRATS